MKKANQPKAQVKTGAAKQAPKKKLSRRGRIVCLCVLVAVILGALVGGFFGIRAALGYGRDFNYMNKDLSASDIWSILFLSNQNMLERKTLLGRIIKTNKPQFNLREAIRNEKRCS